MEIVKCTNLKFQRLAPESAMKQKHMHYGIRWQGKIAGAPTLEPKPLQTPRMSKTDIGLRDTYGMLRDVGRFSATAAAQ